MNKIRNIESLYIFLEQKSLKAAIELLSAPHYFSLLMQFPSIREVQFEGVSKELNMASIVLLAYIESVVCSPQFEFLIEPLIHFIKENLQQMQVEHGSDATLDFTDQITKILGSMQRKEVKDRINIFSQNLIISKGAITNIVGLAKVLIDLKDEFSDEIATRAFPFDLCIVDALTGKSKCSCTSSIAATKVNIITIDKITFIGYDKATTQLINAECLKIIPQNAAIYEVLKKNNKVVFEYLTDNKVLGMQMVDSSFLMVSNSPEIESSGEKEKKRVKLLDQIVADNAIHKDAMLIENYRNQISEYAASIDKYKKQIAQATSQVTEKENENFKLVKEKEALTEKHNLLMNENNKLNIAMQALQKEHTESKDKVSEYSIKIKEMQVEVNGYKILQLDSQAKQLKEIEEINNKNKLEVESLNQQIANLKAQLTSYESKIKSQDAMIENYGREKAATENKIQQEEAQIKDLTTLQQDLQNKCRLIDLNAATIIDNLTQQKKEFELKIKELTTKLESCVHEKEELGKQKDSEGVAKLNAEREKASYAGQIHQIENKNKEEIRALQMQLIDKEKYASDAIKKCNDQHQIEVEKLNQQLFSLETENAKINKLYSLKREALRNLKLKVGLSMCDGCKVYKHTALFHCNHKYCRHCIKNIVGEPTNTESRVLSSLSCANCQTKLIMEDIATVKRVFAFYQGLKAKE